ncbi:hypothetical protein GCM10007079_42550 [Nocardiopsis terrae]|uniref:Excreted virulence factor EspC, type VII ESX diderm n=1 Tax=Nocardiopsis terrae TaxID=372655 RepID=A0ABR9HLU0_9ACTN|nr:hypothetical protein [Nocardiopsis terrae]MBE1459928.1 hypothetical protein [Nocardiopsis terrae]GHC93296.1 hypothetical protein GCM10007079_42550 [Nocardiopsis terrae]
MPGHELGVNVQDAYGAGANAEQYASSFEGLHSDFTDVLDAAKDACADEPQLTGWSAYGEEQADAIARVEHHGVALAENVQGGASDVANTDTQASEQYAEVGVPPSLPVNFH